MTFANAHKSLAWLRAGATATSTVTHTLPLIDWALCASGDDYDYSQTHNLQFFLRICFSIQIVFVHCAQKGLLSKITRPILCLLWHNIWSARPVATLCINQHDNMHSRTRCHGTSDLHVKRRADADNVGKLTGLRSFAFRVEPRKSGAPNPGSRAIWMRFVGVRGFNYVIFVCDFVDEYVRKVICNSMVSWGTSISSARKQHWELPVFKERIKYNVTFIWLTVWP